jgi:hypothetical protein
MTFMQKKHCNNVLITVENVTIDLFLVREARFSRANSTSSVRSGSSLRLRLVAVRETAAVTSWHACRSLKHTLPDSLAQ